MAQAGGWRQPGIEAVLEREVGDTGIFMIGMLIVEPLLAFYVVTVPLQYPVEAGHEAVIFRGPDQ